MFQKKIEAVHDSFSSFRELETLQVNLGDLCNLSCGHCHHGASPHGTRIMAREVMARVTAFLARHPGLVLDITGGCPEMNPHFRHFVEATAGHATRRIVRSNLAIALEPGMEWLPDFYRQQELVVMASLPCYQAENVDSQRGRGVFERSIEALRRLNRLGYGRDRELHLVYNPASSRVAGSRESLEEHYRVELQERFGVSFSRLHCMNNAPIGRFRNDLERKGTYRRYLEQLAQLFNPLAAGQIMCRTLVSVGWDGTLYNCDFNLAAALPLQDAYGSPVPIELIDAAIVPGSPIRTAEHCFSCTAGQGSGCGGSAPEAAIRAQRPASRDEAGVAAC
jgi:radical SAM/Cys-rich protein